MRVGCGSGRFDDQAVRARRDRRVAEKSASAGPPVSGAPRAGEASPTGRSVPRPPRSPARCAGRQGRQRGERQREENAKRTMSDCLAAIVDAGQSSAPPRLVARQWGGCKGGLQRGEIRPGMAAAEPSPEHRAMNETLALLSRRRSLAPANSPAPGPTPRARDPADDSPRACPITASSRRGASSSFEGEARERAGRIALEIKLADDPDARRGGPRGRAGALLPRAAGRRGRFARRAARQNPGMGAGAFGGRGRA